MYNLQRKRNIVMTKKQLRQAIYDKFGGKCAYCGCELNGKFHVDYFEPIRRHFWKKGNECDHPERDCVENKMPSCASCNIIKSSQSLDGFRQTVSGFVNSLNAYNTQYRAAKRYGLLSETPKEVKFYFETLTTNP